jgi:uncharacterized protein
MTAPSPADPSPSAVSGPLATVASLPRYPVKSMLGEDLDVAEVGPAGVLGDRAYAVVDVQDGTVASAKQPRKWGRLLQMRAVFDGVPRPGWPPPPVRITLPGGDTVRSDDRGVDAALSEALGRRVRLAVQVPAEAKFEELWPAIEGLAPSGFIAGTTTSHEGDEPVSTIGLAALAPPGTFFDLATLHVLTTATLDRLRRAAPGSDFDPRRYRPNVVLDVAGASFAEDAWVGSELGLGESVAVTVTMPTMRCVMTTLAQAGGLPEDRDTLRTIARENRRTIEEMGTWACAGVYADVAAVGTVRPGDTVRTPSS